MVMRLRIEASVSLMTQPLFIECIVRGAKSVMQNASVQSSVVVISGSENIQINKMVGDKWSYYVIVGWLQFRIKRPLNIEGKNLFF